MSQPPAASGQPSEDLGPTRLGQLVILWGVPGVGKSTFARWLAEKKGYDHIDTDAVVLGSATTRVQAAWAMLGYADGPEGFIAAATAHPRPLAVEFGMWANELGLQLIGRLRRLGGEPWWFDGHREAAREAWRQENRRSGRPFEDERWGIVVGVIDINWPRIQRFFGHRIVRTIESGGRHVPPAETYRTMLDISEREVG